MRKILIFICCLFLITFIISCSSSSVSRISSDEVTDLSGKWNDTDSRLVSEKMITSLNSDGFIRDYLIENERKPVVIVGIVRNMTSEHINTNTFIKDIEREIVTSRWLRFVASKIDADLLILLTDIDGLYSRDPKIDPDAHLLHEVEAITDEIMQSAGNAGSPYSTGGMKTKLLAARIASYAGCATVIASGFEPNILTSIIKGKRVGTYFAPLKRMHQRPRWILHSAPSGTIWIDDGAVKALRNHKSLLPSGIVAVEGTFEAGQVVMINDIAKAVPYFNSSEIIEKLGNNSKIDNATSTKGRADVIFRPEDIMFIDNL